MKFSTREDIEAPIEYVFSQVSDFPGLERSALRRGAEVQRVDDIDGTGPGMIWDTAFELRGKRRKAQIELVEIDPPHTMRFVSRATSIHGEMSVDLVAMSRGRTRLTLEGELTPQTLAARLIMQSLKLAKSSVTKRFEVRVASFASELEDRYARRG
ncbi:SRPBCC family protein [Rhodobacteraceae bacterium KMM 6894]|nr:SRPBCC family protein [Rhodobacteraceae bacterium KMM 6894]